VLSAGLVCSSIGEEEEEEEEPLANMAEFLRGLGCIKVRVFSCVNTEDSVLCCVSGKNKQ
jgi:hypothetical protein